MRYIVGLLLGVGLIVLTFILIFRAFSGGEDAPTVQRIDLNSYATTDAVMRFTTDGPINAESLHSRVRITVSNDQILFEEIQGYQGKLKQTKTYPSNPDAYASFLHALSLANYTQGNTQVAKDERGYCPSGRRYTYEALTGGDSIFRWWSISCNSTDGSFLGQSSIVRDLFIKQVPDYNVVMRAVRI